MDSELRDWLRGEFSAINKGIHGLQITIATMNEQLNSLHESREHVGRRLEDQEKEISKMKLELYKCVQSREDIEKVEKGIKDLQDWRIQKSSEWTGPHRVATLIGLAAGAIGGIIVILKVLGVAFL